MFKKFLKRNNYIERISLVWRLSWSNFQHQKSITTVSVLSLFCLFSTRDIFFCGRDRIRWVTKICHNILNRKTDSVSNCPFLMLVVFAYVITCFDSQRKGSFVMSTRSCSSVLYSAMQHVQYQLLNLEQMLIAVQLFRFYKTQLG